MGNRPLKNVLGSGKKIALLTVNLERSERQVEVLSNMLKEAVNEYDNAMEELRTAKARADRASRSKSDFLANMSHEIRTPMNGIIGMINILMRTSLKEDQKTYAEMVAQSADNLLMIINDILDFSKIEAGKLEFETIDFDFHHVIAETVRLSAFRANEKNMQVSHHIAPNIPNVLRGDPGRLRQVITNLLSNAIKFTDQGEVKISIHLSDEKKKTLKLRFDVRDTGIGIAKEKKDLLFQSFSQLDPSTTRRFGGTGLGLAICKSLVEKMGGRIGVQSDMGKGSTFWFTASFARPAPDAKPDAKQLIAPHLESNSAKNKCHRDIRILLVEDNDINQMVVVRLLEDFGLKPDVAENGLEALKMMSATGYDLVLMDIQMPVMDGYEATTRIRDLQSGVRNHDLPIIAMTANAMQGDQEKCLQTGMSDYIAKPVDSQELIIKLKHWLPSFT